MVDEWFKFFFNKLSSIFDCYLWVKFIKFDGDVLEIQYCKIFEGFGKEFGMFGIIFCKVQNKIQNFVYLCCLIVDLIDCEFWLIFDVDVKGDVYEGLLQKNVEDVKGGVGQYFIFCLLIIVIVDCMQFKFGDMICDFGCGMGGFLLVVYDYILKYYQMNWDQKKYLKCDVLCGWEIVDNIVCLCVMNLYLYGIDLEELLIQVVDLISNDLGECFLMVFINLLFGKKSSVMVLNDEGEIEKQD